MIFLASIFKDYKFKIFKVWKTFPLVKVEFKYNLVFWTLGWMHTKFFMRVFSINTVFSPILTEKYICYAEQTRAVLAKLADHGKKMFLITNSPSSFV